MAQNFPSNPTLNTSYTVNNESWTYDGSGWTRSTTATADAILPAQTGNTGKYLTTDGTSASWGTVAAAVPKITSISVTDNSYTVLDDTAVSTAGGYIKITGTGFTAGSQVLIGTVAASSVSFVGSTELRAQLPATAAGTYVVYVVAADGAVAIRVNGITFSATPTWSTGSSLGTSGATISIQLAAVSDTAITYSLAAGSTLPTGLSLSSSGLLSGTVTGVTVDTVYNFTINAVDLENQDSPRTFSITITVKDPYFPAVPLLLETAASSTRSTTVVDSSTNAFTVTRNGTPSTGWISPYQTDGYWGNYFNGSSDYLDVAASTAFNLAGSFTVECWFYLTATPANNNSSNPVACIVNYWTSGNPQTGWEFNIQTGASGTISFSRPAGTGAVAITASYTTFALNTWYHVAVTYNGTTGAIYLNGTALTPTVNAWAWTAPSSPTLRIGRGFSTGYLHYFPGYISNLRITNGTVVYTGNFTPPIVPLAVTQSSGTNIAAITGTATSLLTCQSNRFRDNSTNNFAITVSGTPQVKSDWYPSTFTAPAASPGAALFNGSTDYLTVGSNSALAFGTNNFTIEFWIYLNTTSGTQFFYSSQSSGSYTVAPDIYQQSGKLYVQVSSANPINGTGPTTLVANRWYHIALVKSSGISTLYVNGASEASFSDSNTYVIGANRPVIGVYGYNTTVYYLNGYVSNLRVVNGTAVYTGAFTPPTTPVTAIANTSLLVNLADSNYTSATNAVQNNTFIDTGPYAFPITRNGTPTQGSVTPYWPNGYWSNNFVTSGDCLTGPSNAAFTLGTGDFTIEGWIWPTSTTNFLGIVGLADTGSSGDLTWFYNYNGNTNKVTLSFYGGTAATSTNSVPLNQWTHVAFCRTSGSLKTFINGVLDNTVAFTGNCSKSTFVVGRSYSGLNQEYFPGYISNVRVVKGVAVYTGNFTVPTTPLAATQSAGTNIAAITGTATSVLTCQSNRFKDNSTNNFTITANGTPKVQAVQPFSPAAPYASETYGGSGYFNGSTDVLTLASNAAFGFGTGDFTVEFWVYPLVTANSWSIYHGTATNAFIINTTTSGQVTARSYGVADLLTTTATLAVNAWTHLAVTRSGTTLTIWLNGVSSGTVTNSTNFATTGLYIGRADSVTAYLNGYMSNLRVVKGTAAYTAAFTPPISPVTAITNTSLLVNFTNAAIYDALTQNNAITVGDAKTDTTIYKWSPSSMKFDGTGDWLQLPVTQNLNFGSGNFTIEGWINVASIDTTYRCIFSVGNPVQIYARNGTIEVAINDSDDTVSYIVNPLLGPSNSITANTWAYFAVVRNGTTFTAYVNGVAGTPFTGVSGAVAFSSSGAQVGAVISVYPFTGYIQDLRITRGVARYTANFSVPTLAFQTK
jgi:hypothetical protein